MVGINEQSQEISRDVSNELIRSSQQRAVPPEGQKTIGINGKRTYREKKNGFGGPKHHFLTKLLLCIKLCYFRQINSPP